MLIYKMLRCQRDHLSVQLLFLFSTQLVLVAGHSSDTKYQTISAYSKATSQNPSKKPSQAQQVDTGTTTLSSQPAKTEKSGDDETYKSTEISFDHEHNSESEQFLAIARWHVFHNEPIPVHQMRVDCMGASINVMKINMILNGGICKANESQVYLDKLSREIEACSKDDSCTKVEWDEHQLKPYSDCELHIPSRAIMCTTYMIQYYQACIKYLYTELTSIIVSGLDIVFECETQPTLDIERSIIAANGWQNIDLSYLWSRCYDSINIIGFVEVSLSCPADKIGYTIPTEHPMVQIIQKHVDEKDFYIKYEDYKNNLTLRVICGNVLIPTMHNGLMALSSVNGWIYYQCGTITHRTFNIDHQWINVTRRFMNNTHIVHHETSIQTHCGPTRKFLIVLLLAVLGLAVICEIITFFCRDSIVTYIQRKNREFSRLRGVRTHSDMSINLLSSRRTSTTTLSSAVSNSNEGQEQRRGMATVDVV